MIWLFSGLCGIGAVFALTPSRESRKSPPPEKKLRQRVVSQLGLSPSDHPWYLSVLAVAAFLSVKSPWLFPFLLAMAVVVAHLLKQRHRKALEKKRTEAITAELPVLIELLALAVSAGESPASALHRVARASSGPLGNALRAGIEHLKADGTLVQTLEEVKRIVRHGQVDRCLDSIILGYERGTSLGDVLHAQALDVREQYRRSLIEASARAEIAMMLPVVFLIMPVTIIFALFPSIQALTTPY